MEVIRLRVLAVAFALLTHGTFGLAIGAMAFGLTTGMQSGAGGLRGAEAWGVNVLLLLQFPVLHSLLLTRRGGKVLRSLLPAELGRQLQISLYVTFASLQVLSTFLFWSPSGVVWHAFEGWAAWIHYVVFALAWLLLVKSLADAGLAVQTGAAGWLSVWRRRDVEYGGMPEGGVFRVCRQPIYLAFALILWTAPTWSPDWLLVCCLWSCYCLFGPLHKELRWRHRYADRFRNYQQSVPYFLPRFRR
jgi:protein-S-isoprenylcysteine O-methyltransferase Ste14